MRQNKEFLYVDYRDKLNKEELAWLDSFEKEQVGYSGSKSKKRSKAEHAHYLRRLEVERKKYYQIIEAYMDESTMHYYIDMGVKSFDKYEEACAALMRPTLKSIHRNYRKTRRHGAKPSDYTRKVTFAKKYFKKLLNAHLKCGIVSL